MAPPARVDAGVALVVAPGMTVLDRPPPSSRRPAARVTAEARPAGQPRASPDASPNGSAQQAPPLISLRGVTRRYAGAAGVVALQDANLDLRAGEFVVVLGPSGSGKTTLLNLMGALDRPTEGQIIVAGRELTGAPSGVLARYRRESVSFIFQTFNLFPGLTALENVQFGADVSRRGHPREAALEMLGRVGLSDRLDHFPHTLSGGEQQRVAIARALAAGNPIVLADAPPGELDFRTGVQILALLRDQTATGRVVVVVTHNREIARVADRVVELSSGRIVADRPVTDRASLEDVSW